MPTGDLCWDEVACGGNEPIQDDQRLEEFNVPLFTFSASLTALAMSLLYRPDSDGTINLIWPAGSDFQYTNARGWFKNLDKLVREERGRRRKGQEDVSG